MDELQKAEKMLMNFATANSNDARRRYFAWARFYIETAKMKNPLVDDLIDNICERYGVT